MHATGQRDLVLCLHRQHEGAGQLEVDWLDRRKEGLDDSDMKVEAQITITALLFYSHRRLRVPTEVKYWCALVLMHECVNSYAYVLAVILASVLDFHCSKKCRRSLSISSKHMATSLQGARNNGLGKR